ncbi:MAG: GDSL family lipase [Lachnospiraceae bacterium]|nr:GDSL family lipase [Lachnospiraceae bacterium]
MPKFYDINEIKNKRVHGRTVEGASPLPLFWTHSGVEVNCTGSELWIHLESDCGFHEPWIAYEINGALMGRQMLLPGSHDICLYRSMIPGVVKNIKFYRETQAMSEDESVIVLIKGFSTDGDFEPVKENKLKVEFIGDSITSGEGSYGALDDTEWLAMYMSGSRNYATLLEKIMDVETRNISQGGWGVYVAWDNDLRHNIPRIYEPVCGLLIGDRNKALGAQDKYDFSSWVPDAIIVNLGTNDNSAFTQPSMEVPGYGLCKMRMDEKTGEKNPEDVKKIHDAIVNFLKMLRRDNPASLILWVYGMLGCELEPVIKGAMDAYIKETGDKNVEYLRMSDTTPETVGSHSHPGYKAHFVAAKELGEYLSRKFNVPFTELRGNL